MSQQHDTAVAADGQAALGGHTNITNLFRRAPASANAAEAPANIADPGTVRKKKRLNPIKEWCDRATAGEFGEFSAQCLEDSTLVRRWNESFWTMVGDHDGQAMATEWMDRFFPDELSSSKSRDCWKTLTSLLHRKHPLIAESVDHVIFPLRDGYLHIEADKCHLEAPNRRFGLTSQIHASAGAKHGQTFVPAPVPAESLFGRYLESSLPDLEIRALVQEQCALSFLPNKYQQAAWWVGDGGAGKGTMSKLLMRFHSKVATVDLHKLHESHHLAPLVGATLIMVDEVEQKGRWAEKEFKSIISGDMFTVNPKLKQSFGYQSTAYCIVCSNQEPLIRDDSEGVRRRLVIVPWPGSARARGVSVPDLDRMIFEQEGHLFLGWVVAGLMRVLQRGGPLSGMQLPAAVRAAARQVHTENDGIETWFENCEIIPVAGMEHTKSEIYDTYSRYAELNHLFVFSREAFWKRFWRRPDVRNGGVNEVRGRRGKERLQLIRGLAITPCEIAKAKRNRIYDGVRLEGRATLEMMPDVFSNEGQSEWTAMKFTDEEKAELARLEELEKLSV